MTVVISSFLTGELGKVFISCFRFRTLVNVIKDLVIEDAWIYTVTISSRQFHCPGPDLLIEKAVVFLILNVADFPT